MADKVRVTGRKGEHADVVTDSSGTQRLAVDAAFSGTVEQNVSVKLTADDNVPQPGDIHDSVRIGDGNNEVKVNSDGSINTNVVSAVVDNQNVRSVFNEVLAVVSGSLTNLVQYTVPVGITGFLERISVSGENAAKYDLFVNGIKQETRRTYFNSFNETFEFTSPTATGLPLNAGDIVLVTVIHDRPSTADFEGRIQALEIN